MNTSECFAILGVGSVITLCAIKRGRSTGAWSKLKHTCKMIGEERLFSTRGADLRECAFVDLRNADRAIALVGDNRSGLSLSIVHAVVNMFPFSRRLMFPPRWIYLDGSTRAATMAKWLAVHIGRDEKRDPFPRLRHFISDQYNEQRLRIFLHQIFKYRLPRFAKPQPTVMVVDHAEELLRRHRTDFVSCFDELVRLAEDTDLLRLVFVINSMNAVKALQLMYRGDMIDIIKLPKLSRKAVVAKYGESFGNIFDDCDGNIGMALDYVDCCKQTHDMMSAKDYSAQMKHWYTQHKGLVVEITREEYNRSREQFRRIDIF